MKPRANPKPKPDQWYSLDVHIVIRAESKGDAERRVLGLMTGEEPMQPLIFNVGKAELDPEASEAIGKPTEVPAPA